MNISPTEYTKDWSLGFQSFFIIALSAFLVLGCGDQQEPIEGDQVEEVEAMPERIPTVKEVALLEEYKSFGPTGKTAPLPDVDFSDRDLTYADIAPIIANNCVFCHKADGNAPFALTDYKKVKKRAPMIKRVLERRIMPPWMADNHYSSFFNAPAISDTSRSLVIDWINRGCPSSGVNQYPNHKANVERAILTKPDLVLTWEEEHTITSNEDTYQCFVFDPELEEEVFFSGVEFLSSNPEVIHHLMLYLDTGNVLSDTSRIYWDCKDDGIVNDFLPIQSWSKGMRPFVLNSQLGYRIPPGSKFLLQTHYGNEMHKGRKEKTTMKFFFTKPPIEEVEFQVLNQLDIFYPADKIITETLTYFVEDSISMIGVVPHAHFLTKKFEVFAETKEGKMIPLLKIPYWDYLWQGQFIYDKPVVVPKGATIYCNVVIDNTAANPTQPNDPVRDVTYRTNSTDEMLSLVLLKKPYRTGDENLELAKFLN